MNNIISEMIGVVHHGVNDMDEAITEMNEGELDKETKCSICLETFDDILSKNDSSNISNSNVINRSIVKTKCNHLFCKPCITKWFQENNKCPLCLFDFNE